MELEVDGRGKLLVGECMCVRKDRTEVPLPFCVEVVKLSLKLVARAL